MVPTCGNLVEPFLQAAGLDSQPSQADRNDLYTTLGFFTTPEARLPKLDQCFAMIEEWTKTKTKLEVMETLNPLNVPCGPILSMKELAEEPSLRDTGTIVEVEHPTRGSYLTVGNPIKLSDSPTEVVRSPLLGEHTEEILKSVVGWNDEQIAAARESGSI